VNDDDLVDITPCPNGPLIVRGPVTVRDENGDALERRRKTVALCRCGVSAIKPWCDGSHKFSGFRT
jgi:CDGSH-type Zn-finger protein